MSVLADRLLAIHAALRGLPHAFGGAIALAYCTEEPRGTRDIDLNVFVGAERADEVFDLFPSAVTITAANRAAARRDGQVRVFWGDTPIDVFFDVHDFHRTIENETREVPFEEVTIPVLGCEALIIFKAMFSRSRDWADIEEVIAAGAADHRRTLERLRALLGPADPAVARFAALSDN